jgi:hypothetical protein
MSKNVQEQKKLAIAKSLSMADQIRYVIGEGWNGAQKQKHLAFLSATEAMAHAVYVKAAVAPTTTTNTGGLYYPSQLAGVVLPPTTTPIVTVLANLGAPKLPPNTRILTQAALLEASEIPEDSPYPAAAPSLEFLLSSHRKFGLILAFYSTLLAADNFSDAVVQYVQDQLESAANNATDAFMVALMTSGGTAAASIAGAMSSFAGDLRTAAWIGNPATLATLQNAANPNIGPRGGVYMTLPAIASLAVPAGKLFLQDVKRIAVFDGPQIVARSEQASIVMDSAPASAASAPVNMFQNNMTALKITKYADAQILAAPQVITLAG